MSPWIYLLTGIGIGIATQSDDHFLNRRCTPINTEVLGKLNKISLYCHLRLSALICGLINQQTLQMLPRDQ